MKEFNSVLRKFGPKSYNWLQVTRRVISNLIKTKPKFSKVISYHQSDLITYRHACNWTV